MVLPMRRARQSQSAHVRWLKPVGTLALTAVIVVAGLLVYLVAPALPDPVPGFAARKGTLVSAHELKRSIEGDALLVETRLRSSSGLTVEIGVRRPREAKSPLPLVVLLAGLRTGHRAVYMTEAKQPAIVVAALSYPFRGDPRPRGLGYATWLPRMQTAVIDTTPAVMLAMDYLAQQPWVDSQRVELVGGSLGAFLVSVPAALDSHFKRVWLIHGAGDPPGVIAHLLRPYIAFGPLRELTAQSLALVVASHYLRPERWVGRIAPRPIIVVNARGDESLPAESVAALHRALPKGTEVIWTEGPHVRPGRKTVVEGLVELVAERALNDPPRPLPSH
jgi:dienelactone hydrolase